MRNILACTAAACAALSTAPVAAQTAPSPRVHGYLAARLRDAAPGDLLPVDFVVADRLGYDHWFPRVNRLGVDARRALVMAELKAHAARTQRPLLDRLRAHRDRGAVVDVRSVWLGNFVRCLATRAS